MPDKNMMDRDERIKYFGFDTHSDPCETVRDSVFRIAEAQDDPDRQKAIDDAIALADNFDSTGIFVNYTKVVDDDDRTMPEFGRPVLGLIVWSKGRSYRWGNGGDRDREQSFYEAVYGYFMARKDAPSDEDGEYEGDDGDEIVFVRHHDDEILDSLPRWWSDIATPQTLEME